MKKVLLLLLSIVYLGGSGLYAQQACSNARRDLSTMSSAERTQLRDAIVTYLRSSTNPVPSSSREYYQNVAEHMQHFTSVHSQPSSTIFFTWHRYYIQQLEHWLLANGYPQFVPLPSWNPNFTPMVPGEFFSGANAIAASHYGALVNQNSEPESNADYLGANACTVTNANTFASNVEGIYHGAVHVNIDGAMGTVYSSAATIFWPWHGYVDDLWFCYQRNCKSLTSDLYIKKYNTDDGVTPVPPGTVLYEAPDIWVRNTNDGFQNQTSENLTNTSLTDKAYVYVKVMNRGAAPNRDGTGNITVYWAQGSTGLAWPNPWTGSGPTVTCGGVSRPLGGVIGSKLLRRVNENFSNTTHSPVVIEKDYYIYEFEWDMPDPDNYTCVSTEVWQQEHFCILARMNDEAGTTPSSGDHYANMTNSNNVAMHNITILKDGAGTGTAERRGSILWGNYTNATVNDVKLTIKFDSQNDAKLLELADLTLTIDEATRQQWAAAGSKKQGVTASGKTFKVVATNASISGFTLEANIVKGLRVGVKTKQGKVIDKDYKFHLVQYNDNKIAGGELYIVKKPANANTNSNTQTITKAGISNPGYSANNYKIYPNPAQSSFVIQYTGNMGELMDVRLYDNLGRMVQQNSAVYAGQEISISNLPAGLYIVKIISQQTKAISTQKLVISH